MSELDNVILTPEMLTPAQQQDMADYRPLARPAARKLLEPHVLANPRMVFDDDHFDPDDPAAFDPNIRAFQDPEAYLVKSPSFPIEVGNQSGRMADRRFDDMREMATADERAREIIDESGEIIANGGFIWIVTAHIDDLTDIAYGGQITTDRLYDQGGEPYVPDNKLLMLSMAVSEGEYQMEVRNPETGEINEMQLPMVQVAQTGFNRIIRTWPKSPASIKVLDELKLPGFAVDRWINGNALLATEQLVAEGGIGAMGSSGTTRTKDGAMSPINSKTSGLLSLPNAYMLGMTVWRQSDKPVVRYLGRPVKMDPGCPEQVDDFFAALTTDMNGHIEGGNFRYERPAHRQLGSTAIEEA